MPGRRRKQVIVDLVQKIYNDEKLPPDLVNNIFIPLPKSSKAVRCEDHRPVSLISHTANIWSNLVKNRIAPIIEQQRRDSQYGSEQGEKQGMQYVTDPLYTFEEIWKITDLHQLHVALFMFDQQFGSLPTSFKTYFPNMTNNNNCSTLAMITRRRTDLRRQRPRTTFSSKLPKHHFTILLLHLFINIYATC